MTPGDDAWLRSELRRLLTFGTTAAPGEWLDDDGFGQSDRPRETWLAARSLHVRSLALLMDDGASRPLAGEALAALLGPLRDATHGGWHARVSPEGAPEQVDKGCYEHMFVLLAASTAAKAGLADADVLLTEAEGVVEQRFWDDAEGMCLDSWSSDWSSPSPYRGLNSTMHGVEAMLAAGGRWIERAARTCSRVVDIARQNGWRLPEHFDIDWVPQLEAHRDRPDDPFKPYGATVGHAFEWSRLLLGLEVELGAAAPPQLLEAGLELYATAVRDGWHADGEPGFVYTTDWSGRPIVRHRMHWVAAEAIAAAAVLHRRTADPAYERDHRRWWAYADEFLLDRERGSWHHELDTRNQPASSVWAGKPDLYHAVQATIIPRFPVTRSVAASVLEG